VSAEEINQELAELRKLGRLAEDLNRHLEQQLERQNESTVQGSDPGSGFYLARHVEQDGPLTTGATIEREAQHPEVRLYSHQGNAYGAYPNEASFYGHLGNASSVPTACRICRAQRLTSMVARITHMAFIPTVCNISLQTRR